MNPFTERLALRQAIIKLEKEFKSGELSISELVHHRLLINKLKKQLKLLKNCY